MTVIQRLWYVQQIGLLFKKFHQKQPMLQIGKILHCWKNLGMLRFSRFWDQVFATTSLHTYLPPFVLHQGSQYQIQGQTNFQPTNLEKRFINFLFLLRVWLFGGLKVWSQIAENYPSQKLELLFPKNGYTCHQGVIWQIKGIPIFF